MLSYWGVDMDFLSAPWLLWIPSAVAAYFGAYLADSGKMRAARENTSQILNEMARTTERLKGIEARISGELWMSQWRQNQLRDAYALLIEKLEEVGLARSRPND